MAEDKNMSITEQAKSELERSKEPTKTTRRGFLGTLAAAVGVNLVGRIIHPGTAQASTLSSAEAEVSSKVAMTVSELPANFSLEKTSEHPSTDFIIKTTQGEEVGFFTTRTNGQNGQGQKGFWILGNMYQEWKKTGGEEICGLPTTHEFIDPLNRRAQYFQKLGVQLTEDSQHTVTKKEYDNTVDEIDKFASQNKINIDQQPYYIPPSLDWSSDQDKTFQTIEKDGKLLPAPGSIEENHMTVFDQNVATEEIRQALKTKYFAIKEWEDRYGLPVGIKEYTGGLIVLKCQRVLLQYWKNPTPWTNNLPNQVVVANAPDIAKDDLHMYPAALATPKELPGTGGGEIPNTFAFETLQSGDVWKTERAVGVNIDMVVSKIDGLTYAAKTYLPKSRYGNLQKVEIVWLPYNTEEINGKSMFDNGFVTAATLSTGETVRINTLGKVLIDKENQKLVIYSSLSNDLAKDKTMEEIVIIINNPNVKSSWGNNFLDDYRIFFSAYVLDRIAGGGDDVTFRWGARPSDIQQILSSNNNQPVFGITFR